MSYILLEINYIELVSLGKTFGVGCIIELMRENIDITKKHKIIIRRYKSLIILIIGSKSINHSKNVKNNINGGKYLCKTSYLLQKQI